MSVKEGQFFIVNLRILIIATVLVGAETSLASQAVIESDPMTQAFLRRVLVSGSDFSYPDAAAQQKKGGTCSCWMFLLPDGTVKAITLDKSSGHPVLDNYVGRTLKSYRFKPGTKGPIRWFITFSWPGKIRVVGGKFSHD